MKVSDYPSTVLFGYLHLAKLTPVDPLKTAVRVETPCGHDRLLEPGEPLIYYPPRPDLPGRPGVRGSEIEDKTPCGSCFRVLIKGDNEMLLCKGH